MVTIFTASLTFSNSTFCPHSVFMCFVWISEQTAIISLHNINWLVFITQTQYVYCAVRTGYLIQFKLNFVSKDWIQTTINAATITVTHKPRNAISQPWHARSFIHRDWPHGERTSIESKTPPSCCYLLCQNIVFGRWDATAVIHMIQIVASSILSNVFFLKQLLPLGMFAVGRRTWHLSTSRVLLLPSAL